MFIALGLEVAARESMGFSCLFCPADIDECANDTLCGSHGFCDNTDGSFRCLCDQGFETSPLGWDCVGEKPVGYPMSGPEQPSPNPWESLTPHIPVCPEWGSQGFTAAPHGMGEGQLGSKPRKEGSPLSGEHAQG